MKKKLATFQMSDSFHQNHYLRLKQYCKEHGVSISAIIRLLIIRFLEGEIKL